MQERHSFVYVIASGEIKNKRAVEVLQQERNDIIILNY